MTTGLIWKLLTRAIALIAIAILGLEAYAFFSGPARYHAVPVALDGTLGWSGIPGFEANLKDEAGTYRMRLNDEGFRGRSIDEATSGGSESIFFFGDDELTGLSLREEDLVTSRPRRCCEARQGRQVGPAWRAQASSIGASPTRERVSSSWHRSRLSSRRLPTSSSWRCILRTI